MHYWPMVFAMLVVYMALGVAIAEQVGFNPYIGAAVCGGGLVLYEVWAAGRGERRG